MNKNKAIREHKKKAERELRKADDRIEALAQKKVTAYENYCSGTLSQDEFEKAVGFMKEFDKQAI